MQNLGPQPSTPLVSGDHTLGPHFPLTVSSSSSPAKPKTSAESSQLVQNLGELESIVRDEIQREQVALPRAECPVSLIIWGDHPNGLQQFDALQGLGIAAEFASLGSIDFSARSNANPLHVTELPKPDRADLSSLLMLALEHCRGEVIVLQTDSQFRDPIDILQIIAPIQLGLADVVFGSRYLQQNAGGSWLTRSIGHAVTWLSNQATGFQLTDIAAPVKAFRRDVLRHLLLRERGPGADVELLNRLAALGTGVAEVTLPQDQQSPPSRQPSLLQHLSRLYCIVKYIPLIAS